MQSVTYGPSGKRPWMLDLCCCAGGASRGLYESGFNLVGVDKDPQPHYPYPFIQADVLTLDPEWIASSFVAVWASPPCQRYTQMAKQKGTSDQHPDLVGPVRDLLDLTGLPYVIENVPQAPVRPDLVLCGAMFGLKVVRHRHFELSGFVVPQPAHVGHAEDYITVTGHPGGSSKRDGSAHFGNTAQWKAAMGIDWMPADKIREAIPPAYSRHIGKALYRSLRQERPLAA